MEFILTLIIAAGLAFIPANIARNKGYEYGLWWFYGWMLFIVAFIHSLCLPDKKAVAANEENQKRQAITDSAEALKKFKELYDNGVISEEEFIAQKKKLLG